jgi:alpha-glucosidase
MADGRVPDPPLDRNGRDGARTPMQWEPTGSGGFTEGTPWLEPADPLVRNVADQEADRDSVLWLYRDLIALRRALGADLEFLDTADTVLAYRRGDAVVALNLGDLPAPAPRHCEILLPSSQNPAGDSSVLAPHAGWVARAR